MNETLTVREGTKGYASPEILSCSSNSNPIPFNPFAADIYSFGCLMSDIKFGNLKRKSEEELNEMKNDGLAQIILKCCQQNPSSRPTSKQVKTDLEDIYKNKN